MRKPDGYEGAETKEGGFRQPVAGPTILVITGAVSQPNRNGEQQLLLYLDIAEGPFKGFFGEQSERFNKNRYLRFYQNTEGKSLPFFKGVITAAEESNPGFKFDFNEATLIGKKIGGNLRDEEYLRMTDNTVGTNLRVAYLCSTRSVQAGEHRVLSLKKLKVEGEAGMDQTPPPEEYNQVPSEENLPF